MRVSLLIALGLVLAASSAAAQDEAQFPDQRQRQTPLDTNPSGVTARSSVGQVGQRQTRDTAEQQTGIKPMARVASRVQNRVQNRIRNRIDRYYDPRANAINPFAAAGDQARNSGNPR